MFFRRSVSYLFFAASLAVPLSVLGCGKGDGPKVAAVKPGDMPSDGDWTGVYFSQTYGYLHLIKEGDTVSGKWRTTAGDAWGQMSGTVTGDLYKYEWKEHKIGMVGPSSTSSGRGYFKYSAPKADEAHEISGEWGLNTDETGRTWKAVKQTNMKPNPDSVMPDEIEGHGQGGGWDDEGGEKKPKPKPSGDGEEGSSDSSEDKDSDMPPPVD